MIPARDGAAVCEPARPSGAPQNERRMADLIAAMTGDERDSRIPHLAVGGIIAPQLAHPFDDLQHALDMGLRKLPARRVGRKPPAEAQRARLNEPPALALLAEAV